jgi:hypothetical protein
MRAFAARVIAHETRGTKSFETGVPAAFRAIETLRVPLAAVMGTEGVRAIGSRALALAAADVPWLRALHVKADGSFEGLDAVEAQIGPEDTAEGGIAVLAQLLGLLAAFIGENLTLGLVREVWPNLSLDSLEQGEDQ